jgi:hypothetical protein
MFRGRIDEHNVVYNVCTKGHSDNIINYNVFVWHMSDSTVIYNVFGILPPEQ